ncbi:MAG TPA: ribosome small subunit-dependent GTPase A [Gemmatimonadaceae bacterium]|jgi:ribosome biogenesis GTPase|nr:ribosome small subunit-dependent GTPase A [Gemmatimonadaceae bacterium]HPV76549.1 ribosome small subunit-dependent GTPase A [Gemmatimonadaceae bacterium]
MTLIRARVAAVHRSSLQLLHAGALVPATLSSPLIRDPDPLARPGVGDWVTAEALPDNSWRVAAVEPRHSALVRRAAGERLEPQLLAANIDVALLFAPLPDDVNPRRLVRLAALAWDGGATPVVVLSRADLVDGTALAEAMQQVQSQLPGVDCVAISSMSDEGVAPLRPWLRPSSTLVFLGPSGAGKSTLVNRLAGAALMRTGVVADDGRGKHTTTHRALITLPDDVTVIDTPGLREVGMWVGSAGSEHLFADIMTLAEGCRFGDCTHAQEPGCAVLSALESGTLGADRYDQWRQLQREWDRAERSVHEQRRFERTFGRAVKRFYKDRGT